MAPMVLKTIATAAAAAASNNSFIHDKKNVVLLVQLSQLLRWYPSTVCRILIASNHPNWTASSFYQSHQEYVSFVVLVTTSKT